MKHPLDKANENTKKEVSEGLDVSLDKFSGTDLCPEKTQEAKKIVSGSKIVKKAPSHQ